MCCCEACDVNVCTPHTCMVAVLFFKMYFEIIILQTIHIFDGSDLMPVQKHSPTMMYVPFKSM